MSSREPGISWVHLIERLADRVEVGLGAPYCPPTPLKPLANPSPGTQFEAFIGFLQRCSFMGERMAEQQGKPPPSAAKKTAIRRGKRPVITEPGNGDKIVQREIPVPPPTTKRRPANSPD